MVVEELSNASLKDIRKVFNQLPLASEQYRSGFFQASFIGPWWLRLSAKPSISLSGLSGWLGKKFINSNTATNILKNKSGLIEKFQMSCQTGNSLVDGKTCIYLDYGKTAPIPWRWIKDEMRVLDDQTLLCMTIIDLPLLRKFSFPFLLRREL